MKKLVALNHQGRVIGEHHPRAGLLDSEVDQVLELVDDGFSYAQVAEKMGVSKSCVAHIASGRRRCQTPERYVEVSDDMKKPQPRKNAGGTKVKLDLVSCEDPMHRGVKQMFPHEQMENRNGNLRCPTCAAKQKVVKKNAPRNRKMSASRLAFLVARVSMYD